MGTTAGALVALVAHRDACKVLLDAARVALDATNDETRANIYAYTLRDYTASLQAVGQYSRANSPFSARPAGNTAVGGRSVGDISQEQAMDLIPPA